MLRMYCFFVLSCISLVAWSEETEPDTARVGYSADGEMVTPVGQLVTPAGQQLELPGLRPQAVALSPDGKLLVTAGKTSELIVVDPQSLTVRQRVSLPGLRIAGELTPPLPDKQGQLSYTGLVFAPDGKRLYLSSVAGSIKVFSIAAEGTVTPQPVTAERSWSLPEAKAPRRNEEIPAGLAVSDDGTRLYVCGNLSNQLLEFDTTTGEVLRTIPVGVAPYDVLLKDGKAYVSNWGGRRPGEGDLTGPAGRGTVVRVDPIRHIASEGSVSIIDLATGNVTSEVLVGLHASGLAASSAHGLVACCNAGSDYVSLLDSATGQVVGKLWTKSKPSDLLGAAPNAAVFSPDGTRLYVANGSQNAIAVCEIDVDEPSESMLLGMIPVGWYPGALTIDAASNRLLAANIKGVAREPRTRGDQGDGGSGLAKGFNSHQYFGSLTAVSVPDEPTLATMSERVARNFRAPRIAAALLPPRPNQPPRAVPERIGEPSLIEHVVYIVKENRTYDQVMGACGRGNGDPELCVFGEKVTPNHHKLASEFVLLDNTYCCGILSADGHQWSTTAYSTDYMEKSFAGFPRSYPDGMGVDEDDALAYSPAGFIWDNALAHKKTVRNYGEFMGPSVRFADQQRAGSPGFMDCYNAWKNNSGEVIFACWPSVESLRAISPLDYVGWDMSVPDQFRADFVIRELKQYEAEGTYPQLTIICLPQDHTSGTSPGCPTPAACMADNDLAFGRIVEAYSKSKFWPKMAIFSIEDDPQAGWDHVSGYRTISFVAGPHVKRGEIVSTQYNTISLLRTMEQILGLPPMNQFDASTVPMFDCFTDTPDLRPYVAEPTNVPLDQLNPAPSAIIDPVLRDDAVVSASLNFRQVDRAPEDVLNRILWRAMRGTADPYPAWAISADAEEDDEDEEFEVQEGVTDEQLGAEVDRK